MNEIPILIVDDDEVDRYLIHRDLKKSGLRVNLTELEDGVSALSWFKEYHQKKASSTDHPLPVVVFLDVNMPRLGGFDFLDEFSELRAEPGFESIHFIMLSSSVDDRDKEKALAYDYVQEYLVKGNCTGSELKEKIECCVCP